MNLSRASTRRARLAGLLLFGALAALYAFVDASSCSLDADEKIGRIKGCYTLLDYAVGALSPHRWTRLVEWGIFGLGLGVCIWSAFGLATQQAHGTQSGVGNRDRVSPKSS